MFWTYWIELLTRYNALRARHLSYPEIPESKRLKIWSRTLGNRYQVGRYSIDTYHAGIRVADPYQFPTLSYSL